MVLNVTLYPLGVLLDQYGDVPLLREGSVLLQLLLSRRVVVQRQAAVEYVHLVALAR